MGAVRAGSGHSERHYRTTEVIARGNVPRSASATQCGLIVNPS
jgi:hypothetical protein